MGHTASIGESRVFQIVGTTADTSAAQLIRHSADSSSPQIDLTKSRNATKGSNTIVQDNDTLGQITFRGDDGTDFNSTGATITAFVDGTPGANDMPGRLVFSTTADGSTAATERMRIDSSGNVGIGTSSPNSYSNYATLTLDGSSSGQIDIESGGTKYGDLYTATNLFHIRNKQASGNGSLAFHTTGSGTCAERMRLDSGGRLVVGHTSSYEVYTTSKVQVLATDGSAGLSISRWSNNSSSGYLNIGKSRGAIGTATIVQDDDRLGQINFVGADGTDLVTPAASISAFVDGTPGSNDMPGRLVFSTTADGASSETERMRILSNGSVILNNGNGHTNANLILSKTDAGYAKLEFDVGTSQKAYVELDGSENLVHFGAAGVNQQFYTGGTTALTIDTSQNATFAGTVSDSKGNLRSIPKNTQSSTYTLVAADAGKFVYATGNVTVPDNVFSIGDAITIINENTSTDITITQGSGVTMYNAADAATGNRTLSGKGMATMIFVLDHERCHISGAGLS